MSRSQRSQTGAEPAIRTAYERHGVDRFYQQFGETYHNPHELAIQVALQTAHQRWKFAIDQVLDLACGSGEVSLALEAMGGAQIDGIDPYTYAAYQARTGRTAERYTFEQIAAGALVGRSYRMIACSFALHLVPLSRLPTLALQLSLVSHTLLILTPHKRPQLQSAWGWNCLDELVVERVRVRYYTSRNV